MIPSAWCERCAVQLARQIAGGYHVNVVRIRGCYVGRIKELPSCLAVMTATRETCEIRAREVAEMVAESILLRAGSPPWPRADSIRECWGRCDLSPDDILLVQRWANNHGLETLPQFLRRVCVTL